MQPSLCGRTLTTALPALSRSWPRSDALALALDPADTEDQASLPGLMCDRSGRSNHVLLLGVERREMSMGYLLSFSGNSSSFAIRYALAAGSIPSTNWTGAAWQGR